MLAYFIRVNKTDDNYSIMNYLYGHIPVLPEGVTFPRADREAESATAQNGSVRLD